MSRAKKKSKKVWVKCVRCNGSGKIVTRRTKVFRMTGTGSYWDEEPVAWGRCGVCNGKGKHKTEVLDEES